MSFVHQGIICRCLCIGKYMCVCFCSSFICGLFVFLILFSVLFLLFSLFCIFCFIPLLLLPVTVVVAVFAIDVLFFAFCVLFCCLLSLHIVFIFTSHFLSFTFFSLRLLLKLTSHGILHYLWSANLSKNFSQLKCQYLLFPINSYPANICFFKVINRSTREKAKICLKLTIKTPGRRQ